MPNAADILRGAAAELEHQAGLLIAQARALRTHAARICAHPDDTRALTTAEAAERFGVPPATLRRWAKNRPGLAIPDGRGWRFSPEELKRILAGRVSANSRFR